MKNGVCAVVIARDEQAVIRRCLESLRDLDQVVLYDTGSRDKTADVAERMGWPKVARAGREEPFHFAIARNRALLHSEHRWILSVDADEVLAPGSAWAIRRGIHGSPLHSGFALTFLMRVPESVEPAPMPRFRLFRKDRYAWRNRVQERLVPLPNLAKGPTVGEIPAAVLEHLPGDKAARRAQNLELLKMAVDEDWEDARLELHLGRELMARGDYAAAEPLLQSYERRAASSDGRLELSEALTHLGQCQATLGKLDEAQGTFNRAAAAMPDRRETYFRAAEAFAGARRPLAAREWLKACVRIDPSRRPGTALDAAEVWGDLPSRALAELEARIERKVPSAARDAGGEAR